MTTGKTLVCPCEDVTESEVREAVEDGYADLESLKRYTALATGPCQGKSCLVLTRRILAQVRDVDPADLGTITFRPPSQPVRLGDLAEAARGADPPDQLEGSGGPEGDAGPPAPEDGARDQGEADRG